MSLRDFNLLIQMTDLAPDLSAYTRFKLTDWTHGHSQLDR